jgi:hypothetical protein
LMNEIQFNQFFKEYSLLSHAFDNKIPWIQWIYWFHDKFIPKVWYAIIKATFQNNFNLFFQWLVSCLYKSWNWTIIFFDFEKMLTNSFLSFNCNIWWKFWSLNSLLRMIKITSNIDQYIIELNLIFSQNSMRNLT